MSEWQPIETCPVGVAVLLYQPNDDNSFRSEGMIVGEIERNFTPTIPIWVTPSMVGGWEMECELDRPTHWMPLPEPPNV